MSDEGPMSEQEMKEEVLLTIVEVLGWKISDGTFDALEVLDQRHLDLLLAEVKDGVEARLNPLKIRIAQLQGQRDALRKDNEELVRAVVHLVVPLEVLAGVEFDNPTLSPILKATIRAEVEEARRLVKKHKEEAARVPPES